MQRMPAPGRLEEVLPSRGPFSDLSGDAAAALERIKTTRFYRLGTALFREGHPARGTFVVKAGAVRLSIRSESGRIVTLGSAGPRQVLGLSASLCGGDYESTAEALTDVEVAFVKPRDLLAFLQDRHEVCLPVLLLLSRDLHAAYERLRAVGLCRHRRPRPQPN